ncbi:MAG: ABC transporter ATP-binding protein, partial [Terricaulis sp.]
VIAGVRAQTSGDVQSYGRIAALLELGAGFNPEFTGRDNVLLNGVINGLSQAEMRERLPDIAKFADIGQFFDQPVKMYSSGMFVRLAFAVAIHVDADILIVDEALAVGDARFQNKCYERIAAFRDAGKTIILVTHDATAVAKHCERALVMDQGKCVFDGVPVKAVDHYYSILYPRRTLSETAEPAVHASSPTNSNDKFWDPAARTDNCQEHASYNVHENAFGDGRAEIIDYMLVSPDGRDGQWFPSERPPRLLIKVAAHADIDEFVVGFELKLKDGLNIFGTNTGSALMNQTVAVRAGDTQFFEFRFRTPLAPGDYFLDLGIAENDGSPASNVIHVRRSVCHLTIQASSHVRFTGVVDPDAQFKHLTGLAEARGEELRSANPS